MKGFRSVGMEKRFDTAMTLLLVTAVNTVIWGGYRPVGLEGNRNIWWRQCLFHRGRACEFAERAAALGCQS